MKEKCTMFDDLLQNWVEPSPDSFDAYFYDVDQAHYDLSIVPEFLREYIEYPEQYSGTNKFQFLLYKFASNAKFAIECGTYTGVTTIPLSKGVENNNGFLVCIDLDLSRPLLHERIKKHELKNLYLLQGNSLDFRSGKIEQSPKWSLKRGIKKVLKGPDRTFHFRSLLRHYARFLVQQRIEIQSASPPPLVIHSVSRPPLEVPDSFDLIWIDSAHTYEHTVKELFLFDRYLRPGGVFMMHDIVAAQGVGLVDSTEDFGYSNIVDLVIAQADNKDGKRGRPISAFPKLIPTPDCLMSPVYLAIKTFLSYRQNYRLFKILDSGGLGIIWKPS